MTRGEGDDLSASLAATASPVSRTTRGDPSASLADVASPASRDGWPFPHAAGTASMRAAPTTALIMRILRVIAPPPFQRSPFAIAMSGGLGGALKQRGDHG